MAPARRGGRVILPAFPDKSGKGCWYHIPVIGLVLLALEAFLIWANRERFAGIFRK